MSNIVPINHVPASGGSIAFTNFAGTLTLFKIFDSGKLAIDTATGSSVSKASGRTSVGNVSSVVVTNTLVTSASTILATINGPNANHCYIESIIPGAGSFTILFSGAMAAGPNLIDWLVFN